jgi:hypothetical protein
MYATTLGLPGAKIDKRAYCHVATLKQAALVV